jgi:hypothetical protein
MDLVVNQKKPCSEQGFIRRSLVVYQGAGDGGSTPAATFKIAVNVDPAGMSQFHCPDKLGLSVARCTGTPSMATLLSGSITVTPSIWYV